MGLGPNRGGQADQADEKHQSASTERGDGYHGRSLAEPAANAKPEARSPRRGRRIHQGGAGPGNGSAPGD